MVLSEQHYTKKTIQVLGRNMAYVDEGQGDPIVFLHGNPTSSYLWRNVIPFVTPLGRCIAPDLIGMGDSEKLEESGPGAYRFVEHRRFLDEFLAQMGIDQNVVFVIHDWGSALGFDWSRRHPESVRAIVYMEAIVQPLNWSDWPDSARNMFKRLRSEQGEEIVLKNNAFVEKILPASIQRNLSPAEMAEYRRPFFNPGEDRRPTLTWPREIPIYGDPPDVVEIVSDYGKWLETASVPKLFINANPGMILTGGQREYCRSWPEQQEVTVKGLHFIQEDSPEAIGEAIAGFLKK
ncbi:haloalkane dehalogenase [Desulfosalsimonas propionicica]|uniref:Haloalkane dehalogenase n=1 Tax=Desulfosalsimonas propionicica TaxID=332175 RepID=A0A7W0HM27_9BACT|nr:haloalkane dehalogenase [Desulfosalsimonas propionicica]MBA2882917.1 haloalkane dehalogenase [Desulfosalsimonas propionicica]